MVTSENKKEDKKKLVRREMLNKLMKYDYRALFRVLNICYIVIAGLSVLSGVAVRILRVAGNATTPGVAAFGSFVISIYALSAVACVVAPFWLILVHYYKSLFSAQGYLTLSIPASPEEHIFSKMFTSAVALLLSIVICAVSVLVMTLVGGLLDFADIGVFFRRVGSYISAHPLEFFLYVIEILLLFVFCLILSPHIYFCCISLGQIFAKNRILMAVVVYFAAQAILQAILSVLMIMDLGALFEFFDFIGPHGTLWFFVLLAAGLNVGGFFIQRYVLYNKVNLT